MIRIIVILLFFNGFVLAQDSGHLYKYLHFENFLDDKVKNDSIFMRDMYEAIDGYTPSMRKKLVEAKIEVIVINHGVTLWDFIFSKESCLFNLPEEEDFIRIFNNNFDTGTEIFFTRFYIVYDLEPWKNKADAYHKKYKGLVNKNSFVLKGYKFPKEYFEY